MLKRTPLFAAHQKLGGKLVEFGGWEMPVHYSSIIDEHLCVRRAAGIFDISHMGEVLVSGSAAGKFLNAQFTNDVRKMSVGMGQYTLMCNPLGGMIDDLYAYQVGTDEFLLIINASRIVEDMAWLEGQARNFPSDGHLAVKDVSSDFGAVAIQGPRVVEFIGQLFPDLSHSAVARVAVTDLKKNQIGAWAFAGQRVWVGRTGYTGEDGFEIVASAATIEEVWNKALALGHVACLQPCGLGARDTLRTEMGYPLYGHELDENTTPIEAGLGYFVALDKGDFVGRSVLARQKEKGVSKKCVAFKMTDKSAPPRPRYPIWSGGAETNKIGEVVSGTQSPSLGIGIGMGYVPPEFAKAGTALEIEIRSRRSAAVVVPKPIYKKAV
jgi:aminomethyltransferase